MWPLSVHDHALHLSDAGEGDISAGPPVLDHPGDRTENICFSSRSGGLQLISNLALRLISYLKKINMLFKFISISLCLT